MFIVVINLGKSKHEMLETNLLANRYPSPKIKAIESFYFSGTSKLLAQHKAKVSMRVSTGCQMSYRNETVESVKGLT